MTNTIFHMLFICYVLFISYMVFMSFYYQENFNYFLATLLRVSPVIIGKNMVKLKKVLLKNLM